MASTYSSALRLELMTTGDQSGTWGETTNTNIGTLIEQSITGVLSVAQGDVADLTLSANNGATDQARNAVINLTGALTAARNVVVPTANKLYLVKNSTTGGFAITVKTAAGTGIAVAADSSEWLYCDGTNVVRGLLAQPVVAGGTGAGTAAVARTNLVAASSTDIKRNRPVNPAMQVSQQNSNTAGTTTGYYGADQWATYFVTSAGTITTQRVQSVTPGGAKDRYRVTITTADASLAAGEYLTITQNLEGQEVADFQYGSASAIQSILRFGFKGPAGTYAIALHNSSDARSYVALFTIASGDANTDTVQEFTIPGDTTGTWLTDTGIGITLDVVLACGSTFQGTTGWQAGNILGTSGVSNGMGTGAAVFELFDVGFYADPGETGVTPAWELPDASVEWLRSMRYFYTALAFSLGSSSYRYMSAARTVSAIAPLRYPRPMRIAPTLAFPTIAYENCSNLRIVGTDTLGADLVVDVTAAGLYRALNTTDNYTISARF